MDKIRINDILNFSKEEIPNVRVKFNIYNGYDDPLELYKTDPDEVNIDWFLWRDRRRYFSVGQTA
ncbi:MAG TPA: endonuclease, partial [Faecalibacterium sp.]|nr:endonuclease [Faecalibacterium sp.]